MACPHLSSYILYIVPHRRLLLRLWAPPAARSGRVPWKMIHGMSHEDKIDGSSPSSSFSSSSSTLLNHPTAGAGAGGPGGGPGGSGSVSGGPGGVGVGLGVGAPHLKRLSEPSHDDLLLSKASKERSFFRLVPPDPRQLPPSSLPQGVLMLKRCTSLLSPLTRLSPPSSFPSSSSPISHWQPPPSPATMLFLLECLSAVVCEPWSTLTPPPLLHELLTVR